MSINIIQIIVIIVFASLAYWANENLNQVPTLKPLIKVLIVVIAVLLLLQSVGVLGSSSTIVIK